jgi:5-methylcytosine-specific restriction endonuclease McrA
MSKVFVLDTQKRPLDPVHPGYARLLLKQSRATVYRRYPFTIILKVGVEQPVLQPLRLKLDPGSKTTGIAVINDVTGEVVWVAELTHRGNQIKRNLEKRRAIRRSRRQRKTRYRAPRYQNRQRRKGALPPSLESRVSNVLTRVRRLLRLCPVEAISQEVVRFDTQAIEHPDIEGVEYQQGTRAAYEVREYVLLKWQHQCAYCDAQQVPLELDHVRPRSKHGSNRVSNLVAACIPCNRRKSNRDIREFLEEQPERLARILALVKKPLGDTAAVNATRWALLDRLKALGLPIECGSGGCTKCNRVIRGLPKTHWSDAACVGASTPLPLTVKGVVPLDIQAMGRGSRQMCRMDRFGFPRTAPKQAKRMYGFQTGDLVRAIVPRGTKQGTYVGRVAVRTSGAFNLTTKQGTIQGISHRWCVLVARADGYAYTKKGAGASSRRLKADGSPHQGF